MTRRSRMSIRMAILMVFLDNGNQPLNVGQISRKVQQMHLGEISRRYVERMSVSSESIRKVCIAFADNGWLEFFEARPPRTALKTRTRHYHLPIRDPVKAIEVVRFLCSRAGPLLVQSAYGKNIVSDWLSTWVEGTLDTSLAPVEKRKIVEICSLSSRALERALDPGLKVRLDGTRSGLTEEKSLAKSLIDYLMAAQLLDLAEGGIRRENKNEQTTS